MVFFILKPGCIGKPTSPTMAWIFFFGGACLTCTGTIWRTAKFLAPRLAVRLVMEENIRNQVLVAKFCQMHHRAAVF